MHSRRAKQNFILSNFVPNPLVERREEFRTLRSFLPKRKRNDFNWDCRIRRECIQIRRRIIEAAFYVPQRNFSQLATGGARNPAGFFSSC